MPAKKKPATPKVIAALRHDDATRKNIPSAEQQSIVQNDVSQQKTIRYPRNTDLDPQLVWRGKDEQDWSDLVVNAPPLYIQEKVHPKALIDELLRESKESAPEAQFDLFHDFNGIPKGADKTEFYAHDQNWSNRMILGDSLQVMASLAEREGLRGKVQCIYFDPPYGIKFNSNFQWSTTSRDVKDGKADHITREPEQVKAFRDTWRDGIHSYLTYLRDRLTVARDLLTDSGSIFVQIGDENVHRVRAVMDEVFGDENFISSIAFSKTSSLGSEHLDSTVDHILWYSKSRENVKFRRLYWPKNLGGTGATQYTFAMTAPGTYETLREGEEPRGKVFAHGDIRSQTGGESTTFPINALGLAIPGPGKGGWKTSETGVKRLHCRPTVWTWRALSLEFARRREGFGGMPIASFFRVVDISFEYRGDAVP